MGRDCRDAPADVLRCELRTVHLLHGVVLGLFFAGIVALGERVELASQIPLWVSGLLFGGVVSAFVVALLAASPHA